MRSTTRAGSAAVAAMLLAAGCGTVQAGSGQGGSGRAGSGPGRSGTVPAATIGAQVVTRQQAARLAQALLSRIRLPASARHLSGHPPQAIATPFETEGGTPMVSASALWTVPEPAAKVLGFAGTHAPAGTESNGSGQSGTPGHFTEEFVSYALSRLPSGVSSATLAISVVPAGPDASDVRGEAQVIWYPPRSAAEQVTTAMHAVTVSVTILNPKPRTTTRTFTSAAVVRRLAAMLNGARATPEGLMGCPLLDRTYRLAFAASPGAAPYLVATDTGCEGLQITAGGRSQPTLQLPAGLTAYLAGLLHVTAAPRTGVMHPG